MLTPLRRRLRLFCRYAITASAFALVAFALLVGAASQVLPLAEQHPQQIAKWLSQRAGQPIAFDGDSRLEVDVLCAGARIAIEIDGPHHLADPVAYRRDRRKDRLLQEQGYEVKRGKYVSFRAPGQERFTRCKTLGKTYTEEAITIG